MLYANSELFCDNFLNINVMETIKIDILNPKAKSLLENLADLKLIRIQKDKVKTELQDILDKFRIKSSETPSFDEITEEVEIVRKARYEKKKSNIRH